MNPYLSFRRLGLLFMAIFAVLVGGTLFYHYAWSAPGDRCEAAGKWWDAEGRECAQPISIAEITGRPIGQTRAEASLEKNRELVRIEAALAAQRSERDADAEVQRQRLAAVQGR